MERMSATVTYLVVAAPFILSFGALWAYSLYGMFAVYPYRTEDFRSQGWFHPSGSRLRIRVAFEWLFLGKHGHERYRRNVLRLLLAVVASFAWLLAGSMMFMTVEVTQSAMQIAAQVSGN